MVNLRASTASFAKDLDKAQQLSFNTAREMERSFKRIGGVVATELAVAATAITASVSKSIEAADQMGKLAQKTGLTVQQFSGLAYAAKIADVPVDTLAKSFVILSKNLEKSNEQTNAGKAAHSALATLFKGNIPAFKSTNDAFEQITARLAILPDGFQKTALAAQIFGKSGAQLIPLINENVDGIHRLVAEAQSFGVIIDEKTAKSAEKFNETLKKATTIIEGMGLKLAQQLLPYLQNLADKLLDASKNTAQFDEKIKAAAISVKVLASSVVVAAGALYLTGNAAATALLWLEKLYSHGVAGSPALDESVKLTKQAYADFVDLLKAVWIPALDKANKAADEHKPHVLDLIPVNDALKKSYEEITKKLNDEILTFTQGSAAAELYKLKLLGANDSQLKFVATQETYLKNLKAGNDALTGLPPLLTTQTKLIDKLDDSYEKLLDKGFRAWEAARTPLEKYAKEVADLKVLLDAGVLDQQSYNRLTNEWAQQLGLVSRNVHTLSLQVGSELRQGFTDALDAALFRTGSLIDVFKSLIVKIGETIVQMLILKPLFNFLTSGGLGFGGSFFTSLFGGGRAAGGPVSAGTGYTVGENGPETFYPAVNGTIAPNTDNRSQTVYNIDARGADAGVEERIRRAIAESENRAVVRSIHTQRELALRSA